MDRRISDTHIGVERSLRVESAHGFSSLVYFCLPQEEIADWGRVKGHTSRNRCSPAKGCAHVSVRCVCLPGLEKLENMANHYHSYHLRLADDQAWIPALRRFAGWEELTLLMEKSDSYLRVFRRIRRCGCRKMS